MTQIHFCFRRVNPALSIDFLNVGIIKEGQFVPLDNRQLDLLYNCLFSYGFRDFIHKDDLSPEMYVIHDQVASFFCAFSPDHLEWFQDSLVVVLTLDLESYESSEKEE